MRRTPVRDMRIRKRSQSVAATTPLPQPISCKYQTAFSPPGRFAGPGTSKAAECSNMQANRCLEDQDHRHAEPPVRFDGCHSLHLTVREGYVQCHQQSSLCTLCDCSDLDLMRWCVQWISRCMRWRVCCMWMWASIRGLGLRCFLVRLCL